MSEEYIDPITGERMVKIPYPRQAPIRTVGELVDQLLQLNRELPIVVMDVDADEASPYLLLKADPERILLWA